jgi:restriction system protein
MKPYEFEQLVCDHYRQKGYRVQTTSASNDYGIDVFAEKKGEKIAVQVKMYGGSTRKRNRRSSTPKPCEYIIFDPAFSHTNVPSGK